MSPPKKRGEPAITELAPTRCSSRHQAAERDHRNTPSPVTAVLDLTLDTLDRHAGMNGVLRPLRPWLPAHLPPWVPFRLRAGWARVLGYGLPHRWGYIEDNRPRWRRVWSRLTWRLRKPVPRS